MVILRRSFTKGLFCLLITIHCSLFLSGCGPRPKVTVAPGFKPVRDQETTYIIPFAATLVPETIAETAFNDFVDYLNKRRGETGVGSFVILKEELKEVDPAWLAKQFYISGEIWSYIEDSGCCSTDIRAKARAYLFEPGAKVPSVEVFVPVESFFNHDRSTIERERDRVARGLARELADRIIPLMTPPK